MKKVYYLISSMILIFTIGCAASYHEIKKSSTPLGNFTKVTMMPINVDSFWEEHPILKDNVKWQYQVSRASQHIEKTVTYSVKLKGGAVFNIKVYPEISTRFYRTLTGTLAVKPKLTLNAEMEADLLDSTMSQFTKFDLGIGADIQLGAKFAIFSKTIAEKETDDIEILAPVNFFTLPYHDKIAGTLNCKRHMIS